MSKENIVESYKGCIALEDFNELVFDVMVKWILETEDFPIELFVDEFPESRLFSVLLGELFDSVDFFVVFEVAFLLV